MSAFDTSADLAVVVDTSATETKRCTLNQLADAIATRLGINERDYAQAYVSSASASASITSGTYVNVLANSTIADEGGTGADWTIDDTNKRITYIGTNNVNVYVTCSVSMTSSTSNQVASFRVAKNGTTVAASQIDRKIGTGSDVGALSITHIFEDLSTNDYIELWATLDTSSQTITPNQCHMQVVPLVG